MLATLGTILKWLVLLPVFLAVVLLAIANDQSVTVHLNPFAPEDPVLSVELALYQVGFILFALGAVAGGIVAWNGQRRAHRRAREREARRPHPQPREEWLVAKPDEKRPAGTAAYLPRPGRS